MQSRFKTVNITKHSSNSMTSSVESTTSEDTNKSNVDEIPYLANFIHSIANMPPKDKMVQIGIERSVLGIPANGATFGNYKSIFHDDSFDTWDPSMQPPSWNRFFHLSPPQNIIGSFPDATLFFIFYAQPKDEMQKIAADELIKRGWKYIAKSQKWTTVNNSKAYEFDISSWSVKSIKESK